MEVLKIPRRNHFQMKKLKSIRKHLFEWLSFLYHRLIVRLNINWKVFQSFSFSFYSQDIFCANNVTWPPKSQDSYNAMWTSNIDSTFVRTARELQSLTRGLASGWNWRMKETSETAGPLHGKDSSFLFWY